MTALILPFGFVLAVVSTLAAYAQWRRPRAHAIARIRARDQLRALAPRLPLALIAAECIGRLLPREHVLAVLGPGTGLWGVLFAAVFGGLLPGGPMVAFPLAIALFRAGAGPEAMTALITAWSLFAINRTLLFELPLLGARFTYWRIVACTPLPILAGLLAAALLD